MDSVVALQVRTGDMPEPVVDADAIADVAIAALAQDGHVEKLTS